MGEPYTATWGERNKEKEDWLITAGDSSSIEKGEVVYLFRRRPAASLIRMACRLRLILLRKRGQR